MGFRRSLLAADHSEAHDARCSSNEQRWDMGRSARSTWIIRLLAFALGLALPLHAKPRRLRGVALAGSADCATATSISRCRRRGESRILSRDQRGGRDARPRRRRNRSRELQRHVRPIPDRADGFQSRATGQYVDRVLRVRWRNASERIEYRRIFRLLQLHRKTGSVFVLRGIRQLPADRAKRGGADDVERPGARPSGVGLDHAHSRRSGRALRRRPF